MIAKMTAEERRSAILEAAVKLFSERGFRGTTTRALAEAVGVTEPVLYEHFRSKRDLYVAIIDAKSQEGMARGAALVEPYMKARDDRGFFTAIGRFILQHHCHDPAYLRLLFYVALEDPELGALFHQRQAPAREGLAAYIATRIEEGAFRPVDPALAARAFLSMVVYQSLVVLLFRDDFVQADPGIVVEGLVDIFLKGISK